MRWYKLMLWKAYFDEEYGFTSYVKYLIAIIGVGDAIVNERLGLIIMAGLGYGLFCLFLGKFIFKSKMKDAMLEVQNNVNPFVREMRQAHSNVVPK